MPTYTARDRSNSLSSSESTRRSTRVVPVPDRFNPSSDNNMGKKNTESKTAKPPIHQTPIVMVEKGVVAERPRGRPPKGKIWDLGTGSYVEISPDLEAILDTLESRVIDTREAEYLNLYQGEYRGLLTGELSLLPPNSQATNTKVSGNQRIRSSSVTSSWSSCGQHTRGKVPRTRNASFDSEPFATPRVRAWSDVEETLSSKDGPQTPELAARKIMENVMRARCWERDQHKNFKKRQLVNEGPSLSLGPAATLPSINGSKVTILSEMRTNEPQVLNGISKGFVPEACLVQLWSFVDSDSVQERKKLSSCWGRMAVFGPRFPSAGSNIYTNIHNLRNALEIGENETSPEGIHVVMRDGKRTFMQSSQEAYEAGAKALIVVNTNSNRSNLSVIMAPTPTELETREAKGLVPTVIISAEDAKTMCDQLSTLKSSTVSIKFLPLPTTGNMFSHQKCIHFQGSLERQDEVAPLPTGSINGKITCIGGLEAVNSTTCQLLSPNA